MLYNKAPVRAGLAGRVTGWHVILILGSATSVPTVGHDDHGAEGCAVCQLRDHTVANLTDIFQIRPTDQPMPVTRLPHTRQMKTEHRFHGPNE